MDNSILDRALGLVSSVQDARREGRDELMRTILPEVLQPEELKQAAAPMKEEASKTLHAPKYDRRMKFNTALERSGHKATSEEPVKAKEDPEWLKEAYFAVKKAASGMPSSTEGFDPIELDEVELDGIDIDTIDGKPFKPTVASKSKLLRNLGLGAGALGLAGLGGYGLYKALRKDNKQKIAGDPAFDFAGVTGREGVVTVEDELERTPPLPTEEPMEYDVSNKPVMQKSALYPDETETFTQRHPWVLPAGVGLLGAAAGAIPGGLLGGRAAVRSATKAYQRNLDDVETAYQRAMNTYNRVDNSTPQVVVEKIKENLNNARKAYRQVKESPPDLGYHKALGHVGGGTLGGLTGGSLGVLGGLAANKPQPWEQ